MTEGSECIGGSVDVGVCFALFPSARARGVVERFGSKQQIGFYWQKTSDRFGDGSTFASV